MNIAMRVDIEAPVQTVWSYLDDHGKLPLWMPEVVETSYPRDYKQAGPVGANFQQTIRLGGRKKIYLGKVTAYEHRLLGLNLSNGRLEVALTYGLRPMGTGTRFDSVADISFANPLIRALAFPLRPVPARMLARHLVNLKRLAENEAARPDAAQAA